MNVSAQCVMTTMKKANIMLKFIRKGVGNKIANVIKSLYKSMVWTGFVILCIVLVTLCMKAPSP